MNAQALTKRPDAYLIYRSWQEAERAFAIHAETLHRPDVMDSESEYQHNLSRVQVLTSYVAYLQAASEYLENVHLLGSIHKVRRAQLLEKEAGYTAQLQRSRSLADALKYACLISSRRANLQAELREALMTYTRARQNVGLLGHPQLSFQR